MRIALPGLSRGSDLTRDPVLGHHQERIAGPRHGRESEHLYRSRRASLGEDVTVLVEHGSYAAVGVAGHDRLPWTQRATLHQHRGDGAATLVQVRLDGHALGILVGVGCQVQ